MPDLESLLHRLVQGDVEFVIVGGFAAVAHGVSLPTQDIAATELIVSRPALAPAASVAGASN